MVSYRVYTITATMLDKPGARMQNEGPGRDASIIIIMIPMIPIILPESITGGVFFPFCFSSSFVMFCFFGDGPENCSGVRSNDRKSSFIAVNVHKHLLKTRGFSDRYIIYQDSSKG